MLLNLSTSSANLWNASTPAFTVSAFSPRFIAASIGEDLPLKKSSAVDAAPAREPTNEPVPNAASPAPNAP